MSKKVVVETILAHLLEIMLVYLLLNENLKKIMNLELDLLVVLFSLIILLQTQIVFFRRFVFEKRILMLNSNVSTSPKSQLVLYKWGGGQVTRLAFPALLKYTVASCPWCPHQRKRN